MENIFAKRRARLLAMKAMRENYVPGEKLVTCPRCGREIERKAVAAALSVCPLCGYHFPMGAYYRLSSVLDPGSFRELNGKLTAADPLHFPGYRAKLDAGRRYRRGHHRRPPLCGGRAGQPLPHGQHERRRGGKADPGH